MTCCYWCPNCGWEWRDDRDDLAMALELADSMAYYEAGDTFDTRDNDVANWLRAQVIAALYEGDR